MRGDLDDDAGRGDVDGVVPDLGEEDGVAEGALLEGAEDLHALPHVDLAADVVAPQALGKLLEDEDVVAEDNGLVAPVLVEADEVLADLELVRVAGPEGPAERGVPLVRGPEVLREEGPGHLAPDLDATHAGEEALVLQLLPARLVELGPDEPMQVVDEVVLAHERGREAQAAVRLHSRGHRAEGAGGHDLHLVHDEEAPLEALELREHELGLGAALAREAQHAVGGDEHAGAALGVLHGPLLLGREDIDVLGRQGGPEQELPPPLVHGHGGRGEHQAPAADAAAGRDAHERLPGTAGQHHDAALGHTVHGEHLRERALLVGPHARGGPQHRPQLRVGLRAVQRVLVLLQQGQTQAVCRGLYDLHTQGVHLHWRDALGTVGLRLALREALGDVRVLTEPPEQRAVGGLQEVPAAAQHQLELAYGPALFADEAQEVLVQHVLREAHQELHNLFHIHARGDSGAEGEHCHLVLVHRLRPTNRLRDGDEEVRHLSGLRVEGFKDHPATRADPEGPLGVVGLQLQLPQVLPALHACLTLQAAAAPVGHRQ
mmetsp:Transcript_81210/g.263009  ORF Transcript_81210/g.263009 Transcript_81210/m.263009 type:complete len:546 (+) Transcript_81210:510-2147(+)